MWISFGGRVGGSVRKNSDRNSLDNTRGAPHPAFSECADSHLADAPEAIEHRLAHDDRVGRDETGRAQMRE